MIFSKIKMIKQINQTVVTIALALAVVGVAQAASNIDAVNKWAWGTNGGATSPPATAVA